MLLVLAQFCELGGPSVLFCTQRTDEQITKALGPGAPKSVDAAAAVPRPAGDTKAAVHVPKPVSILASDAGSTHRRTSARGATAPDSSKGGRVRVTIKDGGAAVPEGGCGSESQADDPTSESNGFFSEHRGAHFVSTRSVRPPYSSIIRAACLRSLSCEYVGPGREGPLVFGDDANGYTFAYVFKVKDSRARGFMRWFSFILLHADKGLLVASWSYLTRHLQELVCDLQSRANRTFDRETAVSDEKSSVSPNVRGVYPGMSIGSFRRVRRSDAPLRSLTDLLGEKGFFLRLHQHFTFIILGLQHRFTEEETVKRSPVPCVDDLCLRPDTPDQPFESFAELADVLGLVAMRVVIYNVIVGNQIIVRGADQSIVKQLLGLLKRLIPPACCKMEAFSGHYVDVWDCNMLGLQPDVAIPEYSGNGNYALVDIIVSVPPSSTAEDPPRANVCFRCVGTAKQTYLGSALERVYNHQPPHSNKVEEGLIKSVLLGWIHKAKLYSPFCLTKAARHSDNLKRFLAQLQLQEADLNALRFWSCAFSASDRPLTPTLWSTRPCSPPGY